MLVKKFLLLVPGLTLGSVFIRQETKGDGWKPFVWDCKLKLDGKEFSFKFRMGADYFGIPLGNGKWKEKAKCRMVSKWDVEYFNTRAKPIPPDMDTVLSCLSSNCGCVRDNASWGEFADELGYNVDSIKARKVYRKCQKYYSRLRKLFGYPVFNDFLNIRDDE